MKKAEAAMPFLIEQKLKSVSAKLAGSALKGDATASPLPRAQPRGSGGAHTDPQTPRQIDAHSPLRPHIQDVITEDVLHEAASRGGTRGPYPIVSSRSPAGGGSVEVRQLGGGSVDMVGGLGLGLGTIVRDEKWAGMKVTELIPGRYQYRACGIATQQYMLMYLQ